MTQEETDKAMPSAPETVPASQETGNAPKAAEAKDIRTEMFGSKVKARDNAPPEKEVAKAEETSPPEETNPKAEKKNATERIQEAVRERNTEREMRIKAENENRRLIDELNLLRGIKDADKTPKEQLREIYIEDKLMENQSKSDYDLSNYTNSLPENEIEEFKVNYDYYVMELATKDPDMLNLIGGYPQKYDMINMFSKAVNSGIFTLQEWLSAPVPVRYKKIQELAKVASLPPDERNKYINHGASSHPPSPTPAPAPEPQKKVVPDSIVPNLKSKPDVESGGPKENGFYFRKALERIGG